MDYGIPWYVLFFSFLLVCLAKQFSQHGYMGKAYFFHVVESSSLFLYNMLLSWINRLLYFVAQLTLSPVWHHQLFEALSRNYQMIWIISYIEVSYNCSYSQPIFDCLLTHQFWCLFNLLHVLLQSKVATLLSIRPPSFSTYKYCSLCLTQLCCF